MTQWDTVDEMSMVQRIESEIDTLDQHIRVLLMVSRAEPVGIRKISAETGLQNHNVRFSVRLLEQQDLIKPSPEGLRTTEHTDAFIAETVEDMNSIKNKVDDFREIFG